MADFHAKRCVIYRGESTKIDNTEYINVEEYLSKLNSNILFYAGALEMRAPV